MRLGNFAIIALVKPVLKPQLYIYLLERLSK